MLRSPARARVPRRWQRLAKGAFDEEPEAPSSVGRAVYRGDGGHGAAALGGSIWGALGALICGLTLAFVISMAWLWAPRSGLGRGRRPTHDSFHGLR